MWLIWCKSITDSKVWYAEETNELTDKVGFICVALAWIEPAFYYQCWRILGVMNKTRRLTIVALLSAISFVLMIFPQFPILPGASFLKIDFSIVPVLLGALLLGLKQGYLILILRSVLKLLLNNEGPGDLIGIPMNIVGMAMLITIIVVVMNKKQVTKGSFAMGGLLGTIGLTISMVILNYIYAVPLYAVFANFDIKATIGIGQYLLWMVVPFNLIEGLILSTVSALVFFSIRHVLARMHSQLN